MGFFNWAAPVFHLFADRWDDAGIAEISGWLRPFVSTGGRLLDVGGGTGALAKRLAVSLAVHVTVLDPTPEMISRLDGTEGVDGVLGAAEAMPFDTDAFGALIVTDAFHHFRDQEGAVREFVRVVRPGGGIVVLDLDPGGLVMRGIVIAEKLLGEPGTFFSPDEMCDFMARQGVVGECTRMRGASYRYVGRVGAV